MGTKGSAHGYHGTLVHLINIPHLSNWQSKLGKNKLFHKPTLKGPKIPAWPRSDQIIPFFQIQVLAGMWPWMAGATNKVEQMFNSPLVLQCWLVRSGVSQHTQPQWLASSLVWRVGTWREGTRLFSLCGYIALTYTSDAPNFATTMFDSQTFWVQLWQSEMSWLSSPFSSHWIWMYAKLALLRRTLSVPHQWYISFCLFRN